MGNVFKHFKKVFKHKYEVCKVCFKFGLYWQGIVHDLSKFNPVEFWTSCKYYQGNRSPIEAEKLDKGYSMAWANHHNHNPHHWQYWLDYNDLQEPMPMKIPYKYVMEAIADWIGANRAYLGKNSNMNEVYKHYKNKIRVSNKCSSQVWHYQTRQLWDIIIIDLKEKGLKYVVDMHKSGIYKDLYDNTNKDKSRYKLYKEVYNQLLNDYYSEEMK